MHQPTDQPSESSADLGDPTTFPGHLLADLLDPVPIGILIIDTEERIHYLNPIGREILSLDLPALPAPLERTLAGTRSPLLLELIRHALSIAGARAPEIVTLENPTGIDQRVQVRSSPLPGPRFSRIMVSLIDVTLQEWERKVQKSHERSLELLAAGDNLSKILHSVIEGAEDALPGMVCSILLLEDGMRLRHGAAPSLPSFYNRAIDGLKIGNSVGSCGSAAFRGERVIVSDISTHPNWAPYRDLVARAGFLACWSQPILSSKGEVLGTFAMYYKERREPGPRDLDFIDTTAHMAGIAIERKRAERLLREAHDELELRVERRVAELASVREEMEGDLELAREVHDACLPRSFPTFPLNVVPSESAIRFFHRLRPTAGLAGDFFDIRSISDSEAGLLICDVMGRGVRTSLVTAMLRGLVGELRDFAGLPGRFLQELNGGLSRIFYEAESPMFVTASYVVIDAVRGELRYANAGHPSPLRVRRSSGVIDVLQSDGSRPDPALGFIQGFRYSATVRSFEPQDIVLQFTDGVFQAGASSRPPLTMDLLIEELRSRISLPTERLFEELFMEIRSHSGGPGFRDDICLIAAELTRQLDRAELGKE